jgi:hypothetical protein
VVSPEVDLFLLTYVTFFQDDEEFESLVALRFLNQAFALLDQATNHEDLKLVRTKE